MTYSTRNLTVPNANFISAGPEKKIWFPIAFTLLCLLITFVIAPIPLAQAETAPPLRSDCSTAPTHHQKFWPQTDFSKCTVKLEEIISGGPGKDGIPAINTPIFKKIAETTLPENEPVISLSVNGIAKAYPLRVLVWHEIVNDQIGDTPIAVTYCPLCNASIVFNRILDNQLLDFGTTGNLRHSDLVMYDRQTESWFQQYTGKGLFGAFAGKQLEIIASRLEPYAAFTARHPQGYVLHPPQPAVRPYGTNPYIGYDTAGFPMLFDGQVPAGVNPMEYVVIADGKAWALDHIKKEQTIQTGPLKISWEPGQNSALDTRIISDGRDIGHVTVQRKTDAGYRAEPFKVSFAFVWHAFHPEQGSIITQ